MKDLKKKEKYLVATKEEQDAFNKCFDNPTPSNVAKYKEAIKKTRRLK